MNFFNKSFLKVVRSKTAECARGDVIKHASKVLDHIAQKEELKKYYIGKTYIRQKGEAFDIMNFETWDKSGIQDRWRKHNKQEYGKSGMMVIAVIDQGSIPSGVQGVDKEQYTLALEQALIFHYKLTEKDPRVANNTFTSGRSEGNKSPAYGIYIAYTTEPSPKAKKSSPVDPKAKKSSPEDPKAKKSTPSPNNKK